jgi:integrase
MVSQDITQALRGALASRKGGNFSAITDPQLVKPLMQAISNYSGTFVVKTALRLAPLVFVRPSELRTAEWSQIDFEARQWRYLITKTQTEHIVPLSNQVIEILREIQPLTGKGRYVFPSARTPNGSRPMSDMALLTALRSLGFGKEEMTVHGFRAMARTILDEVLGYRPEFIEHQLGHAVKDANGRAYNRTSHLPEGRKMMQAWADYLDNLKAGATVLPFKTKAS